jgi:hypothetical protein
MENIEANERNLKRSGTPIVSDMDSSLRASPTGKKLKKHK